MFAKILYNFYDTGVDNWNFGVVTTLMSFLTSSSPALILNPS